MLSQFGKLTFAEVRNRVADLDEELLTAEKLTMMINFAPQPDEVKLIEAYDGDKALLGNPEKFFIEILQVPDALCCVCMYVGMYICTYVCMYIYVCTVGMRACRRSR